MKQKFTFIDLFAGIGGFRIALEQLGGICLGYSEIDKYAVETYKKNFNKNESNEREFGDITKLTKLPSADVLVGGVPCQSWSVAGKMRGFEDPRGKLWYDSIRLVEINRPKVFIFENVKGLFDPRNQTNLNLIVNSLEKLNYKVYFNLLNSYDFGLPQNRERIFIVGFNREVNLHKDFQFPKPLNIKPLLFNIFENLNIKNRQKIKFKPEDLFGEKIPLSRNKFQKIDEFNDFFVLCDTRNGHTTVHSWDIIDTTKREKEICLAILRNRRKKIYGNKDGNPLSFKDLTSLIVNLKEHELKDLINKKILRFSEEFGYEFVNSKNSAGINNIYRIYLPHSEVFSTLTATGTKDMIATQEVEGKTALEYKRNFIELILKQKKYRSISPREAARLQGFPEVFKYHSNEKIAHRQFGNAVSVNVVYNLMKSVIDTGVLRVLNKNLYGRERKANDIEKGENMDERYDSSKSYAQYT